MEGWVATLGGHSKTHLAPVLGPSLAEAFLACTRLFDLFGPLIMNLHVKFCWLLLLPSPLLESDAGIAAMLVARPSVPPGRRCTFHVSL